MPAIQDKQSAVAGVWAESLMELAAADGREDDLLEELKGVLELFDREEGLESLLASPVVDDEAKRALIEKALRGRASDLLVDGLQVMRRKGRLALVRAVARAYRAAWLERRGRVEVRVTSAVPLDDTLRAALAAAARRRTGREPILVERVDAGLIGGLVVRIGDDKFDSSVASDLARLERGLLARSSRELLSGKSYFTEDN